jgi:hypothetical protein
MKRSWAGEVRNVSLLVASAVNSEGFRGREIIAWERRRNAGRSRIEWMFTTDKARAKMGRAYPATSKES